MRAFDPCHTSYTACAHCDARPQVAQGGESRPALWAIGHPETPQRSLDIGHKRLTLPVQDNFCDCGLFLLTYADYFTHSLPAAVRTKSRKTLEPPELEGSECPWDETFAASPAAV